MKRLVLSLSIPALALSFNACEQHTVAALPPHYQHKLHDHHDAAHEGDKHAKPEGEKKEDTHPKPEAPAEKKAN